jgi:hypothetical protein
MMCVLCVRQGKFQDRDWNAKKPYFVKSSFRCFSSQKVFGAMDVPLRILDLPEELLIRIFQFLDSKTLLALSSVCVFTLHLISHDRTKVWKHLLKRDFKETNKLRLHFVRSWKKFYFAYREAVKAFYGTLPAFLAENWNTKNTPPFKPQISVDPSFVNSCFKTLFYLEGFNSKVELHSLVRCYYNDVWRLRMGIDTLIRYCCENEFYDDALRIVDTFQHATEWKRRGIVHIASSYISKFSSTNPRGSDSNGTKVFLQKAEELLQRAASLRIESEDISPPDYHTLAHIAFLLTRVGHLKEANELFTCAKIIRKEQMDAGNAPWGTACSSIEEYQLRSGLFSQVVAEVSDTLTTKSVSLEETKRLVTAIAQVDVNIAKDLNTKIQSDSQIEVLASIARQQFASGCHSSAHHTLLEMYSLLTKYPTQFINTLHLQVLIAKTAAEVRNIPLMRQIAAELMELKHLRSVVEILSTLLITNGDYILSDNEYFVTFTNDLDACYKYFSDLCDAFLCAPTD